ncbi:peptide ABC transporter permease [Stenotrophomonas sp. HMWF023]|nr:peptide ABC transporter permease [Stenotrophomonas sp. HMWF023]
MLSAAMRSLLARPLRSSLTSLGIAAGVAAIVMVASIAEGTRVQIASSIAELGANRLDVNSGTLRGDRNALLPLGGLYQLRDQDVRTIQAVPGVVAASGFLRGTTEASSGAVTAIASWIGIHEQGLAVLGYEVAQGSALTPQELRGARRVACLGASTARKLFGARSPINGRLRMNGTSFGIRCVLQQRGQSVAGQDLDDVVIVPMETARRQIMGEFPLPNKAVQQIGVRVTDPQRISEVSAHVTRQLGAARSQRGVDDFHLSDVASSVRVSARTDRSMMFLLLSVAVICLAVGGIGVMNIMLVAITERTGEIGLRMAVGASPVAIRNQFLLESALLCLAGGIIGVCFGVAGATAIAVHQGTAVEINTMVVAAGFLVSVAAGVGFGVLPATRAAAMLPAEALRRL